MLAGVTARALTEYPGLFSAADGDLLSERVSESFARLSDDALAWPYSALQPIPNDLSHLAYILWGGERYRDVGGHPGWSRNDAIASLDSYWDQERLMPYPVGGLLTAGMAQRTDSPWIVSGSGMALAFVATWGGRGLERWRRAAVSAASTIAAPPRFTAHVVLGLALVERLQRTTLR
jgi:hypothetical protein